MPACHSAGGVYIGIILYLMIYCKHGKRILIQNWYAKLVARIFTSLWFCTSPALCLIVKLCFWPHISEWKSHRCERLVSWHNFAFISFIWPKSDHRLALSVTKLLSLSRLMSDDPGCFCLLVVFSASIHHNPWPVSFMKSRSNSRWHKAEVLGGSPSNICCLESWLRIIFFSILPNSWRASLETTLKETSALWLLYQCWWYDCWC